MIEYDKRILGDLLSNPVKGESESSFSVPRFQRKYEWEKENEVLRLVIIWDEPILWDLSYSAQSPTV
jgi:hypothetical protein